MSSVNVGHALRRASKGAIWLVPSLLLLNDQYKKRHTTMHSNTTVSTVSSTKTESAALILFSSRLQSLWRYPLTKIEQELCSFFLFSTAHCEGEARLAGLAERVDRPLKVEIVDSSLLALLQAPLTFATPALTTSLTVATHSTVREQKKIASATYPANDPSEDRAVCGSEGAWSYAAVFDGHGGWQVSDTVSRILLPILLRKLAGVSASQVNDNDIRELIERAFQDTEDLILESIRPTFHMGFGNVAKVGSCVLVALRQGNRFYVANCGDCRAVLGKVVVENGKEEVSGIKLNAEHNCRELAEQERLKAEHPNERDLVVCKNSHACYVKGRLQLTRSIGDAYLKYREFNGSADKTRGRHIPEPYTPPYVDHMPQVLSFTLEPTDKFLILGSDGLWDYLGNKEAAEIVQKGLKNKDKEEVVAARLVERALEIAGSEIGWTLDQLKTLPPGRSRRTKHDDTTAVVMYL